VITPEELAEAMLVFELTQGELELGVPVPDKMMVSPLQKL
jgi:hypothetical protein